MTAMRYYVRWAGRERVVEIRPREDGLDVVVDGAPHPVDLAPLSTEGLFSLLVEGRSFTYSVRFEDGVAVLGFHDREVRVPVEDERARAARLAAGPPPAAGGPSEVRSVMPGVVKEVRVKVGDEVGAGQALLILEAMKMENEIRAAAAGRVKEVRVTPGQAVEKGAALLLLVPPAP